MHNFLTKSYYLCLEFIHSWLESINGSRPVPEDLFKKENRNDEEMCVLCLQKILTWQYSVGLISRAVWEGISLGDGHWDLALTGPAPCTPPEKRMNALNYLDFCYIPTVRVIKYYTKYSCNYTLYTLWQFVTLCDTLWHWSFLFKITIMLKFWAKVIRSN